VDRHKSGRTEAFSPTSSSLAANSPRPETSVRAKALFLKAPPVKLALSSKAARTKLTCSPAAVDHVADQIIAAVQR
jgi:hypothetical protein